LGQNLGLGQPFGTIRAPPERYRRGAAAGTHAEAGTQPGATVEIHRRIRHTFKNYMNCTCVKNDANRRRYVDAAACQSLRGKNAMGQTSPLKILDSPNLSMASRMDGSCVFNLRSSLGCRRGSYMFIGWNSALHWELKEGCFEALEARWCRQEALTAVRAHSKIIDRRRPRGGLNTRRQHRRQG